MSWADRRATIKRLEEERHSRLICYLTSDRVNAEANIQKDVFPVLYEHLRAIGKTERIDLPPRAPAR